MKVCQNNILCVFSINARQSDITTTYIWLNHSTWKNLKVCIYDMISTIHFNINKTNMLCASKEKNKTMIMMTTIKKVSKLI